LSTLRNAKSNRSKQNDRILSVKEREFLRQAIDKEEKKLQELDAEVSKLQLEVDSYEQKSREMKAALRKARHLRRSAELTISYLNELSTSLEEDTDDSESSSQTSAMSLNEQPARTDGDLVNTAYNQVITIENNLKNALEAHLKTAYSSNQQALEECRRVEEDLDANNSFLDCEARSLATRIELRNQLNNNIRHMKEMIGPRRRIPNEVWSLIFWERVTEDEEEYSLARMWQAWTPPFTTLRLTWVCRLWRQIIMEQPPLWCYIAIPSSLYLRSKHKERFLHFEKHSKLYPPTIYTIPSFSTPNSGSSFARLLERFETIKLLELDMATLPPDAISFIESCDLRVQKLVLINTSKDGRRVKAKAVDLSIWKISGIVDLVCRNVLPRINFDSFQGQESELETLHLEQAESDDEYLINFLEETGVSMFKFTMDPPDYRPKIYRERFLDENVTLTYLTTLHIPIPFLGIFNQRVSLPNVHSFTIQLYFGTPDLDTPNFDQRSAWDAFFAIQHIQKNITTFGLTGTWSEPVPDDGKDCCYFISQLPNVEKLVLQQDAIAVTLGIMATDTATIPSKLATLELSNSQDTDEHKVLAFFREYYSSEHKPLSLEISSCRRLSWDVMNRMERVHNELKS
jgi:hypothetical protein